MIWVSFKKWSNGGGAIFCYKRIYWKGYRWTPFIRVFWRYCKE